MRLALLLFTLSACGRVGFDATGGGGGDDSTGDGGAGDDGGESQNDAALIDASMIDAPASSCIDPGTGCTFVGGLACSCFGTPMMVNAMMSENASGLRITPNANTIGAQGSCVRNATPFGAGGAIIEFSQVVSGAQGLTALQVGQSPDVYTMSVRGANLIAEDGAGTVGMTTYNATMMRWLRMRPSAPGVAFEYSTTGVTWTTWVSSTRAPSASYTIRIIGGTLGAVAAPGFAQIESVNLCGP